MAHTSGILTNVYAEAGYVYTPFRDQHLYLTDDDATWLNDQMRLAGFEPWSDWARPLIASYDASPWKRTT